MAPVPLKVVICRVWLPEPGLSTPPMFSEMGPAVATVAPTPRCKTKRPLAPTVGFKLPVRLLLMVAAVTPSKAVPVGKTISMRPAGGRAGGGV